MHTFDVQEILRRTLSGASRQAIAGELGILFDAINVTLIASNRRI